MQSFCVRSRMEAFISTVKRGQHFENNRVVPPREIMEGQTKQKFKNSRIKKTCASELHYSNMSILFTSQRFLEILITVKQVLHKSSVKHIPLQPAPQPQIFELPFKKRHDIKLLIKLSKKRSS